MFTTRTESRQKLVLAACAMALATAVGGAPVSAPAVPVEQIVRYCTASWRNAGIRPQDWEDCTQQTIVELLETLPLSGLAQAISDPDSESRRELNRAVWRLAQRQRRQVRSAEFHEASAIAAVESEAPVDWRTVAVVAKQCLTDRQQKILELARDGWRASEIAEQLQLPVARVSDEKYKAIAKLRSVLT